MVEEEIRTELIKVVENLALNVNRPDSELTPMVFKFYLFWVKNLVALSNVTFCRNF